MSQRQQTAIAAGIAASATVSGLLYALELRIQTAAAAFWKFETKTGTRVPTVHLFDLPPKEAADVEQFPWITIRSRNGSDSEQSAQQNARAVVEIVIGTYSDTDDGGMDVLAVIDAIRSDIGAKPLLENTAYEHVGPLTWETPAIQPRPQWHGFVTTTWSLPRPRRIEEA